MFGVSLIYEVVLGLGVVAAVLTIPHCSSWCWPRPKAVQLAVAVAGQGSWFGVSLPVMGAELR